MATKFGKWLNKRIKSSFRLVSVNAVNTIMVQSDTSLTDLKKVAKDNADKMALEAAQKKAEADALLTKVNILNSNSGDIRDALIELDTAEGK